MPFIMIIKRNINMSCQKIQSFSDVTEVGKHIYHWALAAG
jgi:hypothetical protein